MTMGKSQTFRKSFLTKEMASKDIVLFSEYEDERIQQLKTDLGNIQKQMKLEKHDAVNAIELLIKNTINHFKLNDPNMNFCKAYYYFNIPHFQKVSMRSTLEVVR